MEVDILSAEFLSDPHKTYDWLRDHHPVVATTAGDGAVMLTRYRDIEQVARDPVRFSSASVTVAKDRSRKSRGPFSGLSIAPLTSDPPFHQEARRAIHDHLLPNSLGPGFEADVADVVQSQLAHVGEFDECNVLQEFAIPISMRTMSKVLGIPDEVSSLVEDVARIIEPRPVEDSEVSRGEDMMRMIDELLYQSPERLRSGVLKRLAAAHDGQRETVLGMAKLLLVAGVDSTAAMIANCLHEISVRPHLSRCELLDELRGASPGSLQELLRLGSPTTMARVATTRCEVGGEILPPGTRLLLPFAAANRDPEVFPHPHEFLTTRPPNRQVAFGIGIHKCAGSFIARTVVKASVIGWLDRFPNYSPREQDVAWRGGQIRAPRDLVVSLRDRGLCRDN